MKNLNEKTAREAVRIAAEIMHDAGLCLYEDPASQCRHVYPPEDRATCDKCIERFLMQKARGRVDQTVTNADKIRSMTDDELADYLVRLPEEQPDFCLRLPSCDEDVADDRLIPLERCHGCMKKYLQQEVAEDGDL